MNIFKNILDGVSKFVFYMLDDRVPLDDFVID